MTQKEIKLLEQWEDILDKAVNKNFLHLSNSEFGVLAKIYGDLYGPLSKREMNCNTCRLKALKKMGNDYFRSKEKKRGPGRPRKINLEEES